MSEFPKEYFQDYSDVSLKKPAETKIVSVNVIELELGNENEYLALDDDFKGSTSVESCLLTQTFVSNNYCSLKKNCFSFAFF